ncbi:Uncharacterized ATPase putative transposase [Alkaliphilus metalliredigens QYMF]|uniref:Uncharacterized ATPase putative transposase n=1 Tax=Alkaliphilus metalliredigens (strain QYMF) TaxID=293826 RepID=A6TK99_ALKMQ|nr:AAA family ATPase [Alkaliphilus metalliredigens]ABR46617.1 Uncharacterized ATPase putative transposase [Alkaliphilus metalliredigens QYMF]ABR48090.1 Uncharacterized ATPase putative transposase [Alkaliphilus metalliredigens QYMF]ABR50467.1 Uncharacterized ATPase putative transposase [Alkaliphilus metalliredigens QYMF]
MAVQLYRNAPELAQEMEELLKRTGMSKEKASKEIGYSRTALSRYLSGDYESIELELAIRRFLDEKQAGKEKVVRQLRDELFITRDVEDIMGVCQGCQEDQGLGVIVGKSGFGKTETLKEYAKLDRVCYVECDDSMGSRDLVEAIEEAIGLPQGYGSIWKRVKGIKEFFEVNRGYLLIVDEADKLVTKYTQKKMEILRTIFDQDTVGLVIAGEPKLESMVKGFIARFANRVDFCITLKGLSREEVIEYLQFCKISDRAREELIIRGTNSNTGCFRLLDRTLRNVLRLVEDEREIDLKTIEKVSKMMML